MSFNDVATVSVKENYQIIHFCYISKDHVMNILNDANMKVDHCKI